MNKEAEVLDSLGYVSELASLSWPAIIHVVAMRIFMYKQS